VRLRAPKAEIQRKKDSTPTLTAVFDAGVGVEIHLKSKLTPSRKVFFYFTHSGA